MMQAKGTFEVKITPQEATAFEKESATGRMSIDKTWRGDIKGTSKGVMLTSQTESTGAMAYVALEKVDAQINGKSGSFYFSHSATMLKSDPASGVLNIAVSANSGTDELKGLTGTLTIDMAGGKHSYVFDYELPGHN